jgi:protein arginine N-methyltransferase 1
MYTIHDFGDMIADRGRTEAYRRALRARIRPDAVVLDIGAGPGTLTLLACQAGARRVIAVEADGIVEAARELVAANGFGDRVDIVQNVSTAISLPGQVDVIVAEIHGVLPFYRSAVASIVDARDRWLAPGGAIIPHRETIMAAIVSVPEIHSQIVQPWEHFAGLDAASARRRAVNTWLRRRCPPGSIVVEPAVWETLEYETREDLNGRGSIGWTIDTPCEAHGLCLWFDCETAPGIGFSNAPGAEEHVFEQAFFPWPDACRFSAGDRVDVEIRADLVGEDYLWSWHTVVRAGRGETISAEFDQHQFLSVPFSRDWMRRAGAAAIPSPTLDARVDALILDLIVKGVRLDDIATRVVDTFPERVPDRRRALTRVGALAMRYSE